MEAQRPGTPFPDGSCIGMTTEIRNWVEAKRDSYVTAEHLLSSLELALKGHTLPRYGYHANLNQK